MVNVEPIGKFSGTFNGNNNVTKSYTKYDQIEGKTIKIQKHVQEILDSSDDKNFKDLITYKIAENAFIDVNAPDVAKAINTSYPGIWYCLNGHRKWSAETWLKSLLVIGVAKLKKNKIEIDTNYLI